MDVNDILQNINERQQKTAALVDIKKPVRNPGGEAAVTGLPEAG